MKIKLFLAVLSVVFGTTVAHAMAGKLKSPELAFPAEFPSERRDKIVGVLKSREFVFAGGDFINSNTHLNYSGSTTNLNSFLEKVAKCPGFVMSLSFTATKATEGIAELPPSPEGDWELSHSATNPDHLFIRVNLHSSRIQMADLSLPEIRSAADSAHEKIPGFKP